MHATAPPGLAAQRWSATPAPVTALQATQTFPEHSGFFELPVQSSSDEHSTHLPVEASQIGVPVKFLQCSSAVQAWQAKLPFAAGRQSGLAGSVHPSSVVGT